MYRFSKLLTVYDKEVSMKSKDITQKILESYNDVFADIVNVLLFNGKSVIKENTLFEISY